MKVETLVYRQARPDDMMGCARVRPLGHRPVAADEWFDPQVPPQDMAAALGHLQRTDPKGFHVATRNGRVVAFASASLRRKTHFLSMFWALPTLQSKGVGRHVLTRAFERQRPPASAVRCVFASLDTRAQTLYLKFGMRPRCMFYLFKGPPKRTTAEACRHAGADRRARQDIAADARRRGAIRSLLPARNSSLNLRRARRPPVLAMRDIVSAFRMMSTKPGQGQTSRG